MKRRRLSRKANRRNFRKGVQTRKKNFAVPMRGGFRV